MAAPQELSLAEIRKYMLENGCKVTNHALVKHFKRFLTHSDTQNEARKQFKTYVNILATIKNENNQKYLILRKKYVHECPADEVVQRAVLAAAASAVPGSPGGGSIISEGTLGSPSPSPSSSSSAMASPFRQPPPYKPPPEVTAATKLPAAAPTTGATVEQENVLNYRDCVNEFAAAVQRSDPSRLVRRQASDPPSDADTVDTVATAEKRDQEKPHSIDKEPAVVGVAGAAATSVSRSNSINGQEQDEADRNSNSNKENIPRFSFSSGTSANSTDSTAEKVSSSDGDAAENPISVKEATRKFNRMASEEDAKIISPSTKKKPEKQLIEERDLPEVTLAHPKAKEWIVAMARASYQELAKLANEFPELVKLQDPSTTALHWAAKHGNEDVVMLIAGTHKANVNATTNGGYTPLHLAMQFGRVNIFELLCNTYKANRDLMDCSGNKPHDYRKQRTSVSASTYSKIKAKRKHTAEKDLGFLRIGSLNVRVKKTTEAFSNFLGVGNGNGQTTPGGMAGAAAAAAAAAADAEVAAANLHHQRSHRHHHQHHHHHHHHGGMMRSHVMHPRTTTTMTAPLGTNIQLGSRASVPINSGSGNSSSSSSINTSNKFDKLHKSWGSADNIPHKSVGHLDDDSKGMMPPPKSVDAVKKRQKSTKRLSAVSSATDSPRDSISSSNSSSNLNSGYSSMPSTPNQLRAPICIGLGAVDLGDSDSDSACGFGSNWSMSGRSSLSSNSNLKAPRYTKDN